MRLLDRYLIREWLFPFLICLIGFMVLWIAFDLIEELDEFTDLGMAEIARYYWVTLPGNFFVVVPVALLLSLMYAINQHSRHHEFIAIRNAGVGMFRMSTPYLLVGLLLSTGLYWSNEKWLPSTMLERELIREGKTNAKTSSHGAGWIYDVEYHNHKSNRIWQIEEFHPVNGEMRNVTVTVRIEGQPPRDIKAEKVFWEDGGWTFDEVTTDYAPSAGFAETHPITKYPKLRSMKFDETPKDIEMDWKIAPLFDKRAHKRWSVSLAEIDGYRRMHPGMEKEKDGKRKKAILDAQYHARLAEPLTCLIVVLIAIPFAAPSGRRNAAVGVAAGIIACLAFFMVQQFSMAVAGQLSPHLAAWTPHALFGGISAWQITKVR